MFVLRKNFFVGMSIFVISQLFALNSYAQLKNMSVDKGKEFDVLYQGVDKENRSKIDQKSISFFPCCQMSKKEE